MRKRASWLDRQGLQERFLRPWFPEGAGPINCRYSGQTLDLELGASRT